MIDIAKEFGFKIASFHHAVEAYKVRDLLAENDICASMWADWWGFKLEAYDGIRENIALVDQANACAIVHSDDPNGDSAAEPGSGQGDARGGGGRHHDRPRRRGQVADAQPGEGARHRQGHRIARSRQERGRRDLVRRSVQRLQPRRAGVHRRRADVRPQRSGAGSRAATSSPASCRREVADEERRRRSRSRCASTVSIAGADRAAARHGRRRGAPHQPPVRPRGEKRSPSPTPACCRCRARRSSAERSSSAAGKIAAVGANVAGAGGRAR